MNEAQTAQGDQKPQEPILQFALPLSIANVILKGLGELPLKESMAAVEIVQRQANANIARFRAEAEAASAPQPPPAPPAPPAPAAPAMKVPRKRPARARR